MITVMMTMMRTVMMTMMIKLMITLMVIRPCRCTSLEYGMRMLYLA